ncbi:uncharacterized protein LOC131028369 [Cryptomeria japonica]|uniref:uncharacterized protein LOC131028369 n=1 Tax=Cryptomeria japonica TaxID=3369 RepID=UPI0027D9F1B4|nr:uncharacterized protein LOC131028369 [Cryptomeria japonica]
MSTNNTQVDDTTRRRLLREAIDLLSRALTEIENIPYIENIPGSSLVCDSILRAHNLLSLSIQSDREDFELAADREDEERLTQIIIATDHVNAESESECSICTEPFQLDEDARQMPCHESYIFHTRCIFQWLERRNTCPLCRTRLVNPINGTQDSQSEDVTSTTSNNG